MSKILMLFFFSLLLSSVSALNGQDQVFDAGKYEINTNVNLLFSCIYNGTFCAINTPCYINVKYPDSTPLILNALMGNQSYPEFNISITNTSLTALGTYSGIQTCCQGGFCDDSPYTFLVTGNGRAEPEGIVTVLFSILFLVIVCFLIWIFITHLGHGALLEYDLVDLSFALGSYLGLIAYNFLEQFYVGNLQIEAFVDWLIIIGAFTHVVIPFIFLYISMTMGAVKRANNATSGGNR